MNKIAAITVRQLLLTPRFIKHVLNNLLESMLQEYKDLTSITFLEKIGDKILQNFDGHSNASVTEAISFPASKTCEKTNVQEISLSMSLIFKSESTSKTKHWRRNFSLTYPYDCAIISFNAI